MKGRVTFSATQHSVQRLDILQNRGIRGARILEVHHPFHGGKVLENLNLCSRHQACRGVCVDHLLRLASDARLCGFNLDLPSGEKV